MASDEESAFLESEKQDRAIEAQIAQLEKEKEGMKRELDQLRLEKEAAENKFNRLKKKLAEADGSVSELHMYKASTECARPFGVQLVPKIPNEITLDHICTKLPWSAVRSLSSANRNWREAIQSRWVYDARVQAQSTENLVLVRRYGPDLRPDLRAVGVVYSLIEDCYYKLPPIPKLYSRSMGLDAGELPAFCQCVSLHGKIYVLGGAADPYDNRNDPGGTAKVYMLDVAGQRPWKKVARMLNPRVDFAACVANGKIYALGGRSRDKPVHGCEVYDPQVNKWSPIMPMTSSRFSHQVAVHGEKLVVFAGSYYDRGNSRRRLNCDGEDYHITKNEWRGTKFDLPESKSESLMFTANERAYLMSSDAIYSFDDGDHTFSGKNRHENLFPAIGPHPHDNVHPYAAVALNGEVLALAEMHPPRADRASDVVPHEGLFLLRSIGFDKEDNKPAPDEKVRSLKWQMLKCSVPLNKMCLFGPMSLIQL